MKNELVKGATVQFKMNWGETPTPLNTSIVTTPYGVKRVPDPLENLKIITEPLVVYV